MEDDIPLNIIRKQGGMAVMENLTAVSGVRQLEEHSIFLCEMLQESCQCTLTTDCDAARPYVRPCTKLL